MRKNTTRHMTLLGFVLLLRITGPLTPLHAWDSRRDNKTVAELQLMNEEELANEANDACTAGARAVKFDQLSTRSVPSEAGDYLNTIGRVLRKTNGGTEPQWVSDMHGALYRGSSKGCMEVWKGVRDMWLWQNNPRRQGQAKGH